MANKEVVPSVYEALLEDHRELMRQVGDLREWWSELDDLGTPRYDEMGGRLSSLREILADHFQQEEKGGYLAAALAVAPRFNEEASELCAQHAKFLEALDQFIEQLMTTPPAFQSWQEARDHFEQFLKELRRHEARENAIVQSAFGEDMGTGD